MTMTAGDLFADQRALAIDALHARTAIYTAQPAVDALLDRCDWPRDNDRLVDPSAGDGMFIERALRRLLCARPAIGIPQILRLIEGWEIHPAAARQARARAADVLRGHGFGAADAQTCGRHMVRNADFLTEGPAANTRYDVIAGNPPYLRFVNVPLLLREQYEATLPGHARADLLHSFLDHCAARLAPGGRIAFVTADRWLFNANAAELRRTLGERSLGIGHLERLDAATVFYRPKDRRAGTPPRIHPVAVILSNAGDIAMSDAPIYPDALDERARPGRRLKDIARIELAPLMDKYGVWLLDPEAAKRLPAEMIVPAVDTDDIVDGVLQKPRRYVLATGPEQPPEAVLAHIQAGWHKLPPRHRRKNRPWLPPETWHSRLDLSRPSLLIPRIAKSLKPVRIPAGVLPINHNLTLVSALGVEEREVEAALTSPEAQAWIEARAPRLEGGYLSITTRMLREMPID